MILTVVLEVLGIVAGVFVLIFIIEGTRRLFSFSHEFSRKMVHFLLALPVLLLPWLSFHRISLIIVSAAFLPILFFAILNGRLVPLHGGRRSFGTAYYALAFLILVLLFYPANESFLTIAMLILCIGDSFAALPGEYFKGVHPYHPLADRKTVEGSMVMGFISFGLTFVFLYFGGTVFFHRINPYSYLLSEVLVLSFLCAVLASFTEALSRQGSDNLSIPLTVSGLLYLYSFSINASLMQLLGSGFFGILLAGISIRLRFLSTGGGMALVILGVFLFGFGGFATVLPLLIFFITASVLSKVNGERKRDVKYETEKGSTRDAFQVFANGSAPLAFFLLYQISGNGLFLYGFLASIGAAAADTWATEIGVYSRRDPISIRTFKPVRAGMSGGISIPGSLGALAGAFITVSFGWVALRNTTWAGDIMSYRMLMISGGCAFLGCFIDSISGAWIQGIFRCRVCGSLTEKRSHCGESDHPIHSGLTGVDNDIVNFSSFALAGIAAVLVGCL